LNLPIELGRASAVPGRHEVWSGQLTVQGGHPAMTMTAPIGTIHSYADPQVGVDGRFFRELDDELSDRCPESATRSL